VFTSARFVARRIVDIDDIGVFILRVFTRMYITIKLLLRDMLLHVSHHDACASSFPPRSRYSSCKFCLIRSKFDPDYGRALSRACVCIMYCAICVQTRGDISNTSGRCRAFSRSRELRDIKVHFGRVFPLLGITFTRFSAYFLQPLLSLSPPPLSLSLSLPARAEATGMRFVNCLVCATNTCQQSGDKGERGRKGRDNGRRFLKFP
jgi:hypothetical protein